MTCKLDSSGPTPTVSYTVRGKTTKLVIAPDKVTRSSE